MRSLDGNLLVAGSSVHQIDAGNPGAAFVYRIDADGKAEEIARLTNELDGGIYGSYFGGAVSVHGSTVVVGASGHGGAGPAGSGAAYVFECTPDLHARQSAARLERQRLTIWERRRALQYRKYAVGAPGEDLKFCPDGSSPDANSVYSGGGSVTSLCSYDCGGIYVFDRNGGLWTEAVHIASDRASNDELGSRLRARGDEVIAFAGSYSNPKHLYVLKSRGRRRRRTIRRTPWLDWRCSRAFSASTSAFRSIVFSSACRAERSISMQGKVACSPMNATQPASGLSRKSSQWDAVAPRTNSATASTRAMAG